MSLDHNTTDTSPASINASLLAAITQGDEVAMAGSILVTRRESTLLRYAFWPIQAPPKMSCESSLCKSGAIQQFSPRHAEASKDGLLSLQETARWL